MILSCISADFKGYVALRSGHVTSNFYRCYLTMPLIQKVFKRRKR
jgi:hypothetical protein